MQLEARAFISTAEELFKQPGIRGKGDTAEMRASLE